jgi:prepilin-type N-terminal cleavage/methylation domain-containing protein
MSTRLAITGHRPARSAFTLIEILVVLAIASIVTAISVGGFKAMRDGNQRTSCQTNLVQIYQACRMYAADEGGKFPYYNFSTTNNCSTAPRGTGLWMLYTFPSSSNYNAIGNTDAPIERYIRSAKVLHCPEDYAADHKQLFLNSTNYNPDYLSYQTCDDGVPTYTSVRTTATSDSTWTRQLLSLNGSTPVPRLPVADTVVTWCPWHRGQRKMDNVLFYDGSVQILPVESSPQGNWQREPKDPQ